jgi:hypothetical protein
MTKVNLAEGRKKAESEGLLGSGDYLKLQEGENRIRLLSECLEHPGEYKGTPTFKWLCYVIDRKDGKIKPFFMPHTIYKHIEALQQNPEYVFDEVPMPYDVTIIAKGAGTKEVEHSTVAARSNTPLTPAELALFKGTEASRRGASCRQPDSAQAVLSTIKVADSPKQKPLHFVRERFYFQVVAETWQFDNCRKLSASVSRVGRTRLSVESSHTM